MICYRSIGRAKYQGTFCWLWGCRHGIEKVKHGVLGGRYTYLAAIAEHYDFGVLRREHGMEAGLSF
jgi:hypothetical protein